MQLTSLNLSSVKAIGHDGNVPLGNLIILIESESGSLEIQSLSAPPQALEGIKAIASLATGEEVKLDQINQPAPYQLLENITMIPTTSLACGGSSNIEAIGFESSLKVLQIDFNSGSRYRYFDLPPTKFFELVKADSVGRFFNQEIKNSYRFEKVY